jgi:hypothetical protein
MIGGARGMKYGAVAGVLLAGLAYKCVTTAQAQQERLPPIMVEPSSPRTDRQQVREMFRRVTNPDLTIEFFFDKMQKQQDLLLRE